MIGCGIRSTLIRPEPPSLPRARSVERRLPVGDSDFEFDDGRRQATQLVLCWATVMQADLYQLIEAAAAARVDQITVSPHLYFDARDAGASDHDLRRAELDRCGVAVVVIDALVSPLPMSMSLDGATAFLRRLFSFSEAECFAVAEALGAPQLMMVHPYGGAAEPGEMIDVIGAIAERAAGRGLGITIEFTPTSLTIDNLESTLRIVDGIGTASVGI